MATYSLRLPPMRRVSSHNNRKDNIEDKREKQLVKMLVDQDVPKEKKKILTTSSQVLALNYNLSNSADNRGGVGGGVQSSVTWDLTTTQQDHRRSKTQQQDTDSSSNATIAMEADKILKEMEYLGEVSKDRMVPRFTWKTPRGRMTPPTRESVDSNATDVERRSNESGAEKLKIRYYPTTWKLPEMTPRVLTGHPALVGLTTLARNFKILGDNGEWIVDDALYRIGWERMDFVRRITIPAPTPPESPNAGSSSFCPDDTAPFGSGQASDARTFGNSNLPENGAFYPGFSKRSIAGSRDSASVIHAAGSPRSAEYVAGPSSESAPRHLTWADSPARLRGVVFAPGKEMVNHVPNTSLLSDKIKLYESLSSYESEVMRGGMRRPGYGIVGHIKMEKFVPTTFRVDVTTDRTNFYREFRPGDVWICKPGNENCGRGIFLVHSLDEFHRLIQLYDAWQQEVKLQEKATAKVMMSPVKASRTRKPPKTTTTKRRRRSSSRGRRKPSSVEPSINANAGFVRNDSAVAFTAGAAAGNQQLGAYAPSYLQQHHRIIQRYITRPLLLDGRKADIRAFMLIASTEPYLVLFRPGYVRLAIDPYQNSPKTLMSHLTNQCVQRCHPDYEERKDESVWSIERFNDYVNKNVAPLIGVGENWVTEILPSKMKKIMVQCFQAVRPNLPSKESNGRFEILGFDFLIDDRLNVWLIEANVNPSLATNNKTLAEVVPLVVQEALYISIECFEKQKYVRGPLSPIRTRKHFDVIYEEYSATKWIYGQNTSPRWSHAFLLTEEERRRFSFLTHDLPPPPIRPGELTRVVWNGVAMVTNLISRMVEEIETAESERGSGRESEKGSEGGARESGESGRESKGSGRESKGSGRESRGSGKE